MPSATCSTVSLALPLLVAWLAPAAGAQSVPPPLEFRWEGATDWDGTEVTKIGRSVVADFTGDGTRDVFTLVNDRPVFFHAPESWNSFVQLSSPTGVRDIEPIPDAQPFSSSLATVGGGGLQRCEYDAVTGTFQVTTLESVAWLGAQRVRVGRLDANALVDYVGVALDGRTVLVRRNPDGAGVDTSFALPVGSKIHGIELMQCDTTPEREIVLLDTYGIEFFTHAGVCIGRVARPVPIPIANPDHIHDSICVFERAAAAGGPLHVAWIRRRLAQPDTQELVEIEYAADPEPRVVVTPVVFATDELAVRVVAGTLPFVDPVLGERTYSDLFVSRILNHAPLHLRQRYDAVVGQPGFGGGPGEVEVVDDPTLAQRASAVAGFGGTPMIAVGDFDSDQLPDLFVPVFSGSGSWFQVWSGARPSPYPRLIGDFFLGAQLAVSGTQNVLTVAVNLGDRLAGANAIQVLAWRSEPWMPGTTASYEPVAHFYYQEDGAYPEPAGSIGHELLVPITPPTGEAPGEPCFPSFYWIEARQARLEAGVLLGSGPTGILVVGSHAQELEEVYEVGYSVSRCLELIEPCGSEFGCPSGGGGGPTLTFGPGGVTRRRLAPTGNSIPPPSPTPGPGQFNP